MRRPVRHQLTEDPAAALTDVLFVLLAGFMLLFPNVVEEIRQRTSPEDVTASKAQPEQRFFAVPYVTATPNAPELKELSEPVLVELNEQGQLTLGQHAFGLVDGIQAVCSACDNRQRPVVLIANGDVRNGRLKETLSALQASGLDVFEAVAESPPE